MPIARIADTICLKTACLRVCALTRIKNALAASACTGVLHMALKVLIADDEKLARQELEYLLRRSGDVEVVAQGKNGIEALELIRTHQPDAAFLDVQMPGMDGFTVLKKLMEKSRKMPVPCIVFATAFDHYAVRAFEVNALDYVLKPFEEARIRQTVQKLRQRLAATEMESVAEGSPAVARHSTQNIEGQLQTLLRLLEQQRSGRRAHSSSTQAVSKIVLQAGGRLLLTDQRDIYFAAMNEGSISVVTSTLEGRSNCRTLEEFMALLNPQMFWRVHRSFVVNIEHIQEVVPWFKSSYQLRMNDRSRTEIPVSRAQTKRLRELFNL
jgi:two-component system response regulator LytT